MYRPFFKQHVHWGKSLVHSGYQLSRIFPTPAQANIGIVVMAPRIEATPAVLMANAIPDLALFTYAVQFLSRWRYEPLKRDGMLDLQADGEVVDGYRRIDNITDAALALFRAAYGGSITKDDIFYFVYGLLHSSDYRETYAADLKKMLPRIPLVEKATPYVEAGRALSHVHLGYESVTPYPLEGLDVGAPNGDEAYDFFRVTKMRFGKPTADQKAAGERADRSSIVYNDKITLSGIPDAAYRYMLGSRSAIEWIIDRYQVKTDKPSGIVNDPNDWSREVKDPRYILDLLARIVTVSLETMQIVDNLPPLAIRADQNPGEAK